ncbi:hypothetical protein [Streptomyces zaomyceticus]|uniref:hypothetical protein n=1 Tax=Streptomyces zaomyceticus TaxID=68286 RepID=UPI00342BA6A9
MNSVWSLHAACQAVRHEYGSPDTPLHIIVRAVVDRIEAAATTAIYDENAEGGKAREEAAKLRTELAELKEECQAQRRSARAAAPRMMWTSTAEEYVHTAEDLERFVRWVHSTKSAPVSDSSNVDELRAVIVSQAREIAKLKGESE